MTTHSLYPFKISTDAFKNFLCFILAKFSRQPYYRIAGAFTVVAAVYPVTQWNEICRDRTGIIRSWIVKWYPVIQRKGVEKSTRPTAHRTAIVPITMRPLFVLGAEFARQTIFSSAALSIVFLIFVSVSLIISSGRFSGGFLMLIAIFPCFLPNGNRIFKASFSLSNSYFIPVFTVMIFRILIEFVSIVGSIFTVPFICTNLTFSLKSMLAMGIPIKKLERFRFNDSAFTTPFLPFWKPFSRSASSANGIANFTETPQPSTIWLEKHRSRLQPLAARFALFHFGHGKIKHSDVPFAVFLKVSAVSGTTDVSGATLADSYIIPQVGVV